VPPWRSTSSFDSDRPMPLPRTPLLVALVERSNRPKIRVANSAFDASAFSKGVTETEQQMLLFVRKSASDLDLGKQRRRIEILERARLFVGMRLLQVHTLGWTVEGYFALFPATLRAYAPVDSRTKALFLPFFADGAGQAALLSHYGMRETSLVVGYWRRSPLTGFGSNSDSGLRGRSSGRSRPA